MESSSKSINIHVSKHFHTETYDVSDLVDESWRVRLGINEREDGGNIPGMLFASWPVPDIPPGTSSKGDSDPASSSDDSSATPRYIYKIFWIKKNFEKKKIGYILQTKNHI